MDKQKNSKQTDSKPELYTVLAVVYSIMGKTVRVVKNDKLDDACNIEDKLRWNIGDEFKVCKIECLPWGIFLHNNKGQNLNYKRAKLVR